MQKTNRPNWLNKKISPSSHKEMRALLEEKSISTICQEALCPNISECFKKKVATFMILGTSCTRTCSFCAVSKEKPMPPNPNEPKNIALAIKELGLNHAVITSPTRDDLSDNGAEHFCKTVKEIKEINKETIVELLISDMQEDELSLKKIAISGAEIIGHNLETVPRLYNIRKGAHYNRSLRVLQKLSIFNPACATKSGIMLGFGESDDEVLQLMQDLLSINCKLLSIGQYLAPSSKHAKVIEYVKPERFEFFKNIGLKMGFSYIKSSPYTRSSYLAHEYLEAI